VVESGRIRGQMGRIFDQEMATGHGTLCTIPPITVISNDPV
jgi:hypothetical protein